MFQKSVNPRGSSKWCKTLQYPVERRLLNLKVNFSVTWDLSVVCSLKCSLISLQFIPIFKSRNRTVFLTLNFYVKNENVIVAVSIEICLENHI